MRKAPRRRARDARLLAQETTLNSYRYCASVAAQLILNFLKGSGKLSGKSDVIGSRKNRRPGPKRTAGKSRGRKVEHGGLARHYELYVELYNDLREGTYLAGDALPSEPDLMRRFQVSRSTVRRALKRLEHEGRIDRRHGSGTYATGSGDAERAQLSLSNLMESLRDLERTGSLQWIDFDTVPTPVRVLKRIRPLIRVFRSSS